MKSSAPASARRLGGSSVALVHPSGAALRHGRWDHASQVCAWMVLLAFGIDLALVRGGAYLPSGIPGVHLPDLLFFLGALGGTVLSIRARFPQPRGMWILAAVTTAYIAMHLIGARVSGAPLSLAIRDLAPFIYLLALPGVTYLISRMSSQRPMVVVRGATAVLALWVGLSFFGLDLAGSGAEISQHLFSLNADVAGVALALGIVAWGRQDRLPSVPLVQMALGSLGLLLQSRVAAAAVLAAGLIVIFSQSGVRAKGRAAVLTATTVLISVLLAAFVTGQSENRWIDSPLPGLSRAVLPTERTAEGTIRARTDTWGEVVTYGSQWPRPVVGSGVGSEALAAACDGRCAVAGSVPDLRYPHNIELSIYLYQGVVGVAIFVAWMAGLGWNAYRRRPTALQWLGLTSYFLAAQFGVVLESPFGLVPFLFFAAWILSKPPVSIPDRTHTGMHA